ncbi:MAG: hypothetical protein HFH27_03010 [Clostridiaceae bacterium]|nr:hypothetical protein [Clostridiaceae bacterium]
MRQLRYMTAVIFVLCFTMLASGCTASTAAETEGDPGVVDVTIDEELGRQLFEKQRSTSIVYSDTISGSGNGSKGCEFKYTKTENYYRVYVENTGDAPFVVRVRKDDGYGAVQAGPVTMQPGDKHWFDMEGDTSMLGSKTRYVEINPVKGQPFEAFVRVRIASSNTE